MATRVGIELSPTACRIVEVDHGPPWRHGGGQTRVRSFAVLPPSGRELRARLESLRRRQAAVVVWGGRAEHRQVMVTAASYEAMRAEALASLAAAGLRTSGAWADIAPATPGDDRAARRPVVVSMVSASEVSEALQPLRDAGLWLRTVTTPAIALSALARMRQPLAVPGAIESYVAFDEQATCIALVRNGVLLAARDLSWGHVDENYAHRDPRSREEITALLADAIGGFVAEIGGSPADIGQVCVCGGLSDLRTMSTALMERLDVEVEPLDSLFGIDAAHLPAPADEFRERAAELRLAWAAAADWPPTINLLRARRRLASRTWLARAAVVAGAAAGLGGSWWLAERSRFWPVLAPPVASSGTARGRAPAPVKPSVARVAPPVVANRPSAAAPQPAVVNPQPAVVNRPPSVTLPPSVASKPPVATSPAAVVNKAPIAPPAMGGVSSAAAVARSVEPAPSTASPVAVNRPRVTAAPPMAANKPAMAMPPVTRKAAAPAPSQVAVRAAAVPPPIAAQKRPAAVAEKTAAQARPVPLETAAPFDAVLGTILYSPDRKLAIIDNRIVGVGDEVRGARVTEITAGAVLLRDAQGKLRQLRLGAGGR